MRLPFPSTLRFKVMLQQGVALDSLDPSYVSSLSWYFLTLFGLRGLLAIVLGEGNAADDVALMRQQQAGAMGGGPAAGDQSKLFAAELDNLKLVQHEWLAQRAEQRVVAAAQRWHARATSAGSGNSSGSSSSSSSSSTSGGGVAAKPKSPAAKKLD